MTQQVVVAHHSAPLVVLSVLISLLGAYAWRGLAQIVRSSRGRAFFAWVAVAAAADAGGTWSMHYTGELALRLPVPIQFDWRLVVLSWLVCLIGSGAALLIVGRDRPGWKRALLAGACLGAGISGLHYTSMAAMRLPGLNERDYSAPSVVLSILVAIVMSAGAIKLAFRRAHGTPGRGLKEYRDVVMRGVATAGMHYTAMAGVVFASSGPTNFSHVVDVFSLGVVGISVVPLMAVVVAFMASLLGRLQSHKALLDELFEQAPQAVALMTPGDRIVRVNREFSTLFGYTADESIGKRLSDLIGGVETREDGEWQEDVAGRDRRVEVEGVYRRKEEGPLHVSMVRVPVSLPDGQLLIYAIFVDISERKKAEEALQLYPRRLLETQESERQRMARELHDEIGQVLTSLGLMLAMIPRLRPEQIRTQVAETLTVLNGLIGQVGNLALDLRPAVLDDLGLSAALSWLFGRYASQTGVRVHFEQQGLDDRRFNAEIEITAYRIIQEGLTNIARHSGVRDASVRVWLRQDMLRVQVQDLGAGFNPKSSQPGGVGLTGMRQRATILGGRLTVESSPGAGTRITADLPLNREA